MCWKSTTSEESHGNLQCPPFNIPEMMMMNIYLFLELFKMGFYTIAELEIALNYEENNNILWYYS